MNDTEKLEEFGKKVEEFGKLAKSKGFDKENIIKSACIIACSEQMEEHYGDELKAMDKVIELCTQYDDGEKFLQQVLLLAGIE